MTATFIISVWAVLLVLFLIANKRWWDRMERMDREMQEDLALARGGKYKKGWRNG